MAQVSLGFNLSASAVGMSQGINAGVVELQKLGYAAKKTAADVSTLKTIELSRVFIGSIRAAGSAFSSFITGTAGAVAQVDDLSKRTGIAANVIQGYQLAAGQSGVSLETFGRAIQKLTVNLGEAQTGNKAAIKSFGDLGLSVSDLSRLSPGEAFNAVASALTQLPGPAQQAAAAVGLFGKSGVELVPIFQEGAGYLERMTKEAQRLGLVLRPEQIGDIAQLDDALSLAADAIRGFSARLVAELAPSLTQAAQAAVEFLAKIDVREIANATSKAISTLGQAFALLSEAALPLANNILPAIGAGLAIANREALKVGLRGLADSFTKAALAAGGYATAAGIAAGATGILKTAVRGLLSATVVGAIGVGVGILAEKLVEYGLSGESASENVAAKMDDVSVSVRKNIAAFQEAGNAASAFGQRAREALKVPEITQVDFAQNSLSQAESALKQLVDQVGGLGRVPQEISNLFFDLTEQAKAANNETIYQKFAFEQVDAAAKAFTARLTSLADARKRDADAAKAASDAARKAAEDARSRVGELATQSLPASEQSRLQLMKDMAAIALEQRNAEEALFQARAKSDAAGIFAAEERLRLAKGAASEAQAQDRLRRFEARGLDANLLKPSRSILDDFKEVRSAFNAREINGDEARQALRNLAAEGIQIRQDILAELSRPSQKALQVNDIRTSEGISSFLGATREDPAIADRREQLLKLEEIRRALIAIGAQPVEILG